MAPLYKKYANTEPVGVIPLSNFGGIEILDIEQGTDDYIIACDNYGVGRDNFRRHKIEYLDGRPYFRRYGNWYYLNEIMRGELL